MWVTLVAACAMILATGATLPNIWQPLLMCGALAGFSFFWQPNLLRGLAATAGFGVAFTLLMEAVASTGNPLVDAQLAAADSALGLSAPATVAFVRQYPGWELALKLAYFSVLPQTALLLLIAAESPALGTFLRRFFLAALITLCFFYFWPAEGVATSVTPAIAARFHALRSGADISWQSAQGIITFPSFHTAWAILLAAGFWPTRLRWPAAILNALMITSTVPVGGHYFVDVAAGAVVGVLTIAAVAESESPHASLALGRRVWMSVRAYALHRRKLRREARQAARAV